MVDDRRARIRRNMARAWAFAAAAYADSVGASIPNITWDLYGNPVGLGGGSVSATLSTPAGGVPTLESIGTLLAMNRTVGATEYVTTASVSVGTASANRRVFFVLNALTNAWNNVVACSIGGVAGTVHVNAANFFTGGAIMSADVPTGTVVSLSLSFIGGLAGNVTFNGYIFVADKSAFANASPTVRSATGATFNTSPLTASISSSADACILAVAAGEQLVSQFITVSPSANFAYTTLTPGGNRKVIFANNVPAQLSTLSAHAITVTDSVAIAIMVWR